jgi:hypothetical protein
MSDSKATTQPSENNNKNNSNNSDSSNNSNTANENVEGVTLTGTKDGDILTGGKGDDILTGEKGVDTFVWKSGESDTDTIADFDVGAKDNNDDDVLNLADLLQSEHLNAASLGNYLSFNFSDGNTTLTIDADGTLGAATQLVVLQGIDLTSNNTLSTSAIINTLLADGHLDTDAS